MTRSHRASLMTAFACAALFASWDLKAEIPKFTEDFLGLKYSDTSSTTAWWDVVEGMLRLYPYQPVIADTLDTHCPLRIKPRTIPVSNTMTLTPCLLTVRIR